MYARVAQWKGADAESMKATAAEIKAQAEAGGGPPPGVPSKEFLLLQDPEGGRVIAIMLFESEDDYRQGNEVLDSMSPPSGGLGDRVSVDKYELAVHVTA
jgi:hypothetical protein